MILYLIYSYVLLAIPTSMWGLHYPIYWYCDSLFQGHYWEDYTKVPFPGAIMSITTTEILSSMSETWLDIDTHMHGHSGYPQYIPQYIINQHYAHLRDFTWCSSYPQSSSWGMMLCQLKLVLWVSALHYLAGSWILKGFWTVASAHVLCQPTIAGLSISYSVSTSSELNWNGA